MYAMQSGLQVQSTEKEHLVLDEGAFYKDLTLHDCQNNREKVVSSNKLSGFR